MIAIPVKNSGDNPEVDERFGRANMFCLVDNNGIFRILKNTAKGQTTGAGGMAVKLLADEDVTTVISPHIGPKAMDVINTLKIDVYQVGDSKTVKEALEGLKNGTLKSDESQKQGLRRV